MRLLERNDYKKVENLLKEKQNIEEEQYKIAIEEITKFFDVYMYKEFLNLFYFERYKYKNRYSDNRSMMRYLCKKLFTSEPQLYMVRKEIVYKSAMIFYKYNLL